MTIFVEEYKIRRYLLHVNLVELSVRRNSKGISLLLAKNSVVLQKAVRTDVP